jgi:DNA-binding NarL/FixJ family response regulator
MMEIDMKKIRVLIADDHPLFRDGLRVLLEAAEDLELAAEAETGEDAVRLAVESKPDLTLMDVNLPGINGIEAARQITAALPGANLLMLTMFDDDHSVYNAMRAGARGYILKGAKREEMLRAIRAAASGEAIFSPEIAARMMNFFTNIQPSQPAENAFPELTEREREILSMLARDYKNTESAAELFLSVKTVRNHVSNILSKLQVADRIEAARRAPRAGLG